ncbi:hypothetical protein DY052_08370 [Apilactobacillus timberlakei]|uniref:hypothetical protein n=1 Tax=Apilactobacillus timberlakei TaxID=2008380 RepID=UPI00112BA000|nr:hypothetical protein [Apilactobacillus timberlakei]TPR13004.1 hypothetical protein DY052_08370 [Apilactobacillus timberlakei]
MPNNRLLTGAALSVGIPIILIAGLGYKLMSANSQLNNTKAKITNVKRHNHDQQERLDKLSSDNIAELLQKQGIIGTNVINLQNNMTDKIIKNMKVAYSAKSDDDFNKIDHKSFSGDLINILTNYDDLYKDGSYAKHPQYKRQGIKNISVEYGKYNHKTSNVYALVNIDYDRFHMFDKSWDGTISASPHDTYTLKCNLKNGFADVVKYNPAKNTANKPS